MMTYLIHTVPGSPFGRSVITALDMKGQDWRIVPLPEGGTKSAEHLARHPFGKIPVLEKPSGELIYETQAILRHLDRVYPMPPLFPTRDEDATRVDQALGIIDCYLFPGVGGTVGFERLVRPLLLGETPDEDRIAAIIPSGQTCFAALSRLLGNNQYLGGDSFSVGDIVVGAHLELLSRTPEFATLVDGCDNLLPWLARVEAHPAMQRTVWEALADRVAQVEAIAA